MNTQLKPSEPAAIWLTVEEAAKSLRMLGVSEHLDVCEVPLAMVDFWPQISSNRIIITDERRFHYLARHPEMLELELALLLTLGDPDLIQSSSNDDRIAYLHRLIDRRYFLRAALLISTQQGLHNSLLSAWKIRAHRVEARHDVVIWSRR